MPNGRARGSVRGPSVSHAGLLAVRLDYGKGGPMPTRRIFELVLVEIALARPVFGMARLWAHKRLGVSQPGTFLHGVAEVMVVLL